MMFTIIILAALQIALASEKIVTGINCQINPKNEGMLQQTWADTKYGVRGGALGGNDGNNGRLFEFDCQKRCYDSDGTMGMYWMTCGTSSKTIAEMQDNDEVVVDVRTEAYDDHGGCSDSLYQRAMSLDATGRRAVDTFGRDGHWGYFLCYRTVTWKKAYEDRIQYVSELQARTSEEENGNLELIGQWDTHNAKRNFAYGDNKWTGHFMYLYRKKEMPKSAFRLKGRWQSYTKILKPWADKVTMTRSQQYKDESQLTEEEKTHWSKTMSSSHKISTSVTAAGVVYGADVSSTASSESMWSKEENQAADTAIKSFTSSSISSTHKETHEYPVPAATPDRKSYTFWWFQVEAEYKDDVGVNQKETFAADWESTLVRRDTCGRNIAPNCLPSFCEEDDFCWECTSDEGVINPGFQRPYYCEHGEGCDWYPIDASECPPEKELQKRFIRGFGTLKSCSGTNNHGDLCEGPRTGVLVNGKNAEINNCYGEYDIFRFDCPLADKYDVEISTGRTDVEMTLAFVGDGFPSFTLNDREKPFEGEWNIMNEGEKQFSDRDYVLTNIPHHLRGAKYWKGPCHSYGASMTVQTSGNLYVLVSHGDGFDGEKNPFVFIPEPKSTSAISMHTTSFPKSSTFQQWVWENYGCESWCADHGDPWSEKCEYDTGACSHCNECSGTRTVEESSLNAYSTLNASEDFVVYGLAFVGLVTILILLRSTFQRNDYKTIEEASKLDTSSAEL